MTIFKALYFAALIPPKDIQEEIRKLKLEIKEKYNASHALKLPAHITILRPFWLNIEKEIDLLNGLRSNASEQQVVPVQLRDFGHFGQRVLFIDVVEHEPVKQIFDNFSVIFRSLFPEASPSSIHPHITLATRDLSRENFNEAWKEFKTRSYMDSFTAEALVLLKHNGKSWDILKEFKFSGSTVI